MPALPFFLRLVTLLAALGCAYRAQTTGTGPLTVESACSGQRIGADSARVPAARAGDTPSPEVDEFEPEVEEKQQSEPKVTLKKKPAKSPPAQGIPLKCAAAPPPSLRNATPTPPHTSHGSAPLALLLSARPPLIPKLGANLRPTRLAIAR